MQAPEKARFELVPKSELHSFALREFRLPAFSSWWHFHPECELTLILHGRGKRFVGDNISVFGPGDLVLLGSSLPHCWRNEVVATAPEDYAHSVVLQFREECLGADFLLLPESNEIRQLLIRARRGMHFGSQTRDQVSKIMLKMRDLSGLDRLISLLTILRLLINAQDVRVISSSGFSPCLDQQASARITRVHQYIFEHFGGRIEYEDIARRAGMSLSAFSHFFKRTTGGTLCDFINEVRIGHAKKLLIATDEPISQIGFESGFESLSNFNRRFRQVTGSSPREYRQEHIASLRSREQNAQCCS